MLNTDGIILAEKSNLSIWPVYLAINEIPIEDRYYIDNIIFAGICVGHSKPIINEFFRPIKKELIDLSIGFEFEKISYEFHLLFGIFDKPARASFLNANSSYGKFGCCKCQQEGESVEYGNGHHVVYQFDYNKIDKPLRTKENYESDLINKTHGIKGECIFGSFKYFKPVLSTNIDLMHSVFLGLMKNLFEYWFDHPNSAQYSLKSNIEELNEKLTSCRPTQYIQQAPRSFNDYKKWRAHEFMNFTLYFSIPTFYRTMPEKYFKHFLFLIIPIEHLLKKAIKTENLELIHKSLIYFVQNLENLYDKHIMKSANRF